MALFDLSENALVDERKAYAKTVKAEREEVRLSGRYQCLKATIGEIEHGKTVHFVTSGAWSMHGRNVRLRMGLPPVTKNPLEQSLRSWLFARPVRPGADGAAARC